MANQNLQLSDDEKKQSRVISSNCIFVENSLGQLKHWKILTGWNHYNAALNHIQVISFEDVLDVCTGLTN